MNVQRLQCKPNKNIRRGRQGLPITATGGVLNGEWGVLEVMGLHVTHNNFTFPFYQKLLTTTCQTRTICAAVGGR